MVDLGINPIRDYVGVYLSSGWKKVGVRYVVEGYLVYGLNKLFCYDTTPRERARPRKSSTPLVD